MTSIFQRKDAEVNPDEGFWQIIPEEFTINNINVVHRDVVKIKLSEDFVDIKLLLGDSTIYLYEDFSLSGISLLKRANIQWKHFQPFVENRRNAFLYGFKIGHGDNSEEFYMQDSAKLDEWLLQLSRVCIMSDLKLDYQITKVIGKGSYAVVYQGLSVCDRSQFAIKRIKKATVKKSDRHITALENEIASLRLLNHPRVSKLFRVYESPRDVCLVQEAIMGAELIERLANRGKFKEATVKVFAQKLLEALNYLHCKGVVHRDLKPENIILTSDENDIEFKIIDFGLSACNTSTRLFDRCGSPGYVAPEVLGKQPYDSKVDIFSAGVVLYIMLSGRPPFVGDNSREVLEKNFECHIDFKTQELDHVSIDFVNFVQSLTQVDPERRPTAEQALRSRIFLKPKVEENVSLRRLPQASFSLTCEAMSKASTYLISAEEECKQPAAHKQGLHLKKRLSVSKPDFHKSKQANKNSISISPLMKQETRKLSNFKILIGNSSADSSPKLPHILRIISPEAQINPNRLSLKGQSTFKASRVRSPSYLT